VLPLNEYPRLEPLPSCDILSRYIAITELRDPFLNREYWREWVESIGVLVDSAKFID
jgi:hypothetical protein